MRYRITASGENDKGQLKQQFEDLLLENNMIPKDIDIVVLCVHHGLVMVQKIIIKV